MPAGDLGVVHRFVPGDGGRTLLLLHGTGGDEADLLGLGRAVDPQAALLGVRGQVSERGALRYFRRLAPGVFDEADIRERTRALAQFVRDAARVYGRDGAGIAAVGLSNGANMAVSLLLLEPGLLGGAVLLRPMLPLRLPPPPLQGVPVLIAAGRRDPFVTAEQTAELARVLAKGGARVALRWTGPGHGVGPEDVEQARAFLAGRPADGAD